MKIVKKIMKWLGIGIGALLVLIIIASLVMNVVFSRELRQTMAQLKAEGRALTVAKIRPAPVPDDQNAAPLMQKASELMGYGAYNKPAPKAAPAIKELSDLINSNNTADISTWPTAHRDALPRLIQAPEMAQLFAILREASQKPGYNNNLKYEDGPSMLLPNLDAVRQTIRFLSIKAELAAQNGNTEEAWATLLEGLKLVDLLKQEPILITQLVRIACDIVMINYMERMADKTDVPPKQAQVLIAELARHTDAIPWIRCMEGERIFMGIWVFNRISGQASCSEIAQIFGGSHSSLRTWFFKYNTAPILGSWTKKDFTVYLKLMSQMEDYYKVPYWQAVETIRNHPIDQQIPLYCLLTRLIFPNLDRLVTKNAEHDAAVDVARVGLGLKLFKQKNGAYPGTLENVAPEFLDAIPVDPFTGKALIYRKADAGFILYSLGPNQRDDNGTPRPTAKNATGKEPYDIVWKCER